MLAVKSCRVFAQVIPKMFTELADFLHGVKCVSYFPPRRG